MTRLPIESWQIKPRLDLGTYELNETCPVTGEIGDLEDHHIWRRSFTGLGQDNNMLYWVCNEATGRVYPNRVALDTAAHERITTNRARLEFDEAGDLWYVEGEEKKKLDIVFRLMTGDEKVARPRKKRTQSDEKRPRQVVSVWVPVDSRENGAEALDTLIDSAREKLAPVMNWNEDVPAYFVLVAVLHDWLTNA